MRCIMPDVSLTAGSAPHRRDLTLPAGFIAPCLPMMAPRPPSGPLWLHEIKHDGFRVVARNDGGRVRLYGRTGNDLTERFPLIVDAMAHLPPCTIDGEAVVCDDRGIASFELLRHGKQRLGYRPSKRSIKREKRPRASPFWSIACTGCAMCRFEPH
jgi:ATP-dependent DNA ligase